MPVSAKADTIPSSELGDELEQFVSGLVESGRFQSRVDVLRQGMRLLQEHEAQFTELDASIAEGIADLDAGRSFSAEEVFDELRTRVNTKATV